MEDTIHQFRKQISGCWDDETISPKFLPRQAKQTMSAGQCTATSYVLNRYLQRLYGERSFTMMVGEVWHDGQKVIPYHVWVVDQNFRDPSNSMIIDVAADQSHVLPEVVIASARELAQNGTQYVAYTPIHDIRLLDPLAQKRAESLEEKYSQAL